ncbi:ATP-binding protein [Actinomadura sp. DC4]|uniref:sensor histidine kinase n=1 Tax=Actinomadura sp. DC4 TaxID=3055069 RepID=UPI0025AF2CEB|nr:ATP-binding protein [Actinomadura sp. DC4]MDN3352181.1 ATP-binding protein [Actinomadura sp. DC4]
MSVPDPRGDGRHHRRAGHGKRRLTTARSFDAYLALVPAALITCLGAAAMTVLMVAGPSSPEAKPTLVLAAAGAMAVLCAAVLTAGRTTRPTRPAFDEDALRQRLYGLGSLVFHGRQELQVLAERIAAGEIPHVRHVDTRPTEDPVGQVEQELRRGQAEAWNAVIGAAGRSDGDAAKRVEIFVNLARRMQTLSHRALQGLDELESRVEDPDLLKGLFKVDHLSTRLRRQAESLAVVGGAAPRRQWSRPVAVYEVLRSAVAEVEHFSRVRIVPPIEGTLDGGAVADLIHLLAELVENATKFSPPHTRVLIRAEAVAAGLAVEIEDRGLGIPRDGRSRLNDLFAGSETSDGDALVRDGRIGLLVVSALARRHKIAVDLQTNVFGGTQAVVVIPGELIDPVGERTGVQPAELTGPPDAAPAPTRSPGSGVPAVRTPARRENDADAVAPANAGRRPELPRRRPQENLAPELLNAPAPRDDDGDIGHNHHLMAAFRKGMRSGAETRPAYGTDEPGADKTEI